MSQISKAGELKHFFFCFTLSFISAEFFSALYLIVSSCREL